MIKRKLCRRPCGADDEGHLPASSHAVTWPQVSEHHAHQNREPDLPRMRAFGVQDTPPPATSKRAELTQKDWWTPEHTPLLKEKETTRLLENLVVRLPFATPGALTDRRE